MEELQREGASRSGLLVPTNLATMVVEDKPVSRAQEGVAVSAPLQGFRGERLPQDHMVSHCVRILRKEKLRATKGPGCGWRSTHRAPLRPCPHLRPRDLTRLLWLPWASRE